MRRLALLSLLLTACPAWGAAIDPGALDARTVGLGGALRSLATTSAAARMNPAGLSLRRGFFGAASYATAKSGPFDAALITMVDNITSPMGGAIQYLRLQGEEEREEVSLSLSGGGQRLGSGLWWGFTARYMQARARKQGEWKDVLTGDLGFLFERPGGIRIGVVGYDLLDTSSESLDRRIALGVSRSGMGGWTAAIDAVRNLDSDFSRGLDLHLGAEYRSEGSPWSLRMGQMWTGETGKDYASAGFGWSSANSVEFGYALRKARQDPGGYLHLFTVEGSF